jgi:hypothetical protein
MSEYKSDVPCSNHTVCQKLKAENECFHTTYRNRFQKTLKSWGITDHKDSLNLYTSIIEILELILKSEASPIQLKTLGYCESIKFENELHTIQFFKASYFMECLEKSKLAPVHLHRISVFLQTKIFDSSDSSDSSDQRSLKQFFEEMTSLKPLYECQMCKLFAPPEASLTDIVANFYTSVRNRCKTCFKEVAS